MSKSKKSHGPKAVPPGGLPLPAVGKYFVFTPGPYLIGPAFHLTPDKQYVGVRSSPFQVVILRPDGSGGACGKAAFDGVVKILLDLGE